MDTPVAFTQSHTENIGMYERFLPARLHELSGLSFDQLLFFLFFLYGLHQVVCISMHLVVQFPPLSGSMLTEKSRQLLALLPVSEMCCVHGPLFFFCHSQLFGKETWAL